jgi:hypothetical protein
MVMFACITLGGSDAIMFKKNARVLRRFMDPNEYAFQIEFNNLEDFYSLEAVLQQAEASIAMCQIAIDEIERMLNEE